MNNKNRKKKKRKRKLLFGGDVTITYFTNRTNLPYK